ncbi:hypothetical protein [Methanoregula sp.]|uniref:hypothetical protein n=1 Tax=Methanoregula sp. TaxID=2052170 RepID=UPI0023747741|nr:hypothetical protein [Methanoregula sp.]MDD1687579.1 hypothetical protein [Methanoregula sp.]
MIYNLNNLNALLDAGDIDRDNWKRHFADVPDTRVPTCRDCLDRKNGSCRDNGHPIECFLYGSKSQANESLLKKMNIK